MGSTASEFWRLEVIEQMGSTYFLLNYLLHLLRVSIFECLGIYDTYIYKAKIEGTK